MILYFLTTGTYFEDGIGEQLERSRKMFLRGGRFSGKSYWAAHHIVLSLIALAVTHKERRTLGVLLST